MLKLSANSVNQIWVNASRNKTLSNPTYMMSLEHKVSGERKYFIPFSASTSYQEQPRADLFQFGVFESGENLTGGTRNWYWTKSPNFVYDNANLKGTGKSYPTLNLWVVDNIAIFIVQFDWEDVNDRMDNVNNTGFTLTVNDVAYTGSSVVFRQSEGGGTDEGRAVFTPPINGIPLNEIEKISYTGITTGGTSISNTIYVANWEEVNQYKPWNYYDRTSPFPPNYYLSYPITPLGTTTISLENYGWYYYRIYEQTSQINLNPSLATNIVDEGTLYLYPPPPDEVSYSGYSNNDIVVYD